MDDDEYEDEEYDDHDTVSIMISRMIILGMCQPSGQQGGYKDAGKCCDQCAVELQLCHLQK